MMNRTINKIKRNYHSKSSQKKSYKRTFFLILIIVFLVLIGLFLFRYLQDIKENNNSSADKQSTNIFDFVGQAFKAPKNAEKVETKNNNKKISKENLKKDIITQKEPKIPPAYDESKKKIRLTEEQKLQYDDPEKYAACVEAKKKSTWKYVSVNENEETVTGNYNGCYDPNGDDLKTADAVYYFDYTTQVKTNTYQSPFTDPSLNQCKIIFDKCKEEKTPFVYEVYCDQKGNPAFTEVKDCRIVFGNNDYICDKGRCVLPVEIKKKPDLVVDTIYKDVYGKQCVNSYHFKICNKGDAQLEKQFAMTVKVNGYSSTFNYLFADFPKLKPNECADIIKPDKLTILKFSTSVQSTNDVTVILDTDNEIDELEKKNNEKTASVYSGNGYIYDPATYDQNKEETWCDTFCYDSDDGKTFGKQGQVLFKHNSYISTTDDWCLGDNEIKTQIKEAYCKKIVKYDNTGKFSNPLGWKMFDCTILNTDEQQYKCENNKCVPCDDGICWYATGGVPPEKENICKEIIIDDGNTGSGEQGINEPEPDPFTKGNNDICSDSTSLKDGDEPPIDKDTLPQNVVKAYCAETGEEVGSYSGSSEELSDFEKWLKDTFEDYVPKEPKYFDCSYYSTTNQAYACIDGKCVAIDDGQNKEACEGPKETEIDAYQKNKIIYTAILGDEQQEESDWCANSGDTVMNVFCYGKKWSTKEYNCVKDSAACVDGKCITPDESKKKCTENDDKGIDYEKSGWIDYTTEYDQSDSRGDYCINDDQLIEYYCEGKENKFTDPFSCNSIGKKCIDNACQ
ncbi:hypothetical protein J4232_02470 [Candidatus Woesearchaeota archaeon]|nr:hypothetical protein [Candidatus Woesearchaeota archaeon]